MRPKVRMDGPNRYVAHLRILITNSQWVSKWVSGENAKFELRCYAYKKKILVSSIEWSSSPRIRGIGAQRRYSNSATKLSEVVLRSGPPLLPTSSFYVSYLSIFCFLSLSSAYTTYKENAVLVLGWDYHRGIMYLTSAFKNAIITTSQHACHC